MKKSLKKTLSVLLVSFLLAVLIPAGAWAEETDVPTTAPLNPAFVQYLDQLESGTLNTTAINGHSRGYVPPTLQRYEGTGDTDISGSASLPAAFDLRTTGRISAIRDQGDYGSCWAFASLASLESYVEKDKVVDFSENNLMWNNGFDGTPDDGGNYSMATAYLARWSGPVNESSDPYGTPKKSGLSSVYHVQGVEYIPQSAAAIKQALMDGGALYTSMYSGALDDVRYFNSNTSALYYDGDDYTDHDVAIVGWDDNYPRSNFVNSPPGNGAWIIRNSWGSDWGDGGYFYMSYYDTYAGSNVTAFHNAEATDNYSRVYQYDPLGDTSARGYRDSSNTVWGANIFTAAASENLTAVSTYALAPNTTLEINVYTNVSDGAPTSGTLKTTQTASFQHGGYYTINLNNPVGLVAGQKFSVVIKYNTPGTDDSVPVESPIVNNSSAASANPGESLMSRTGSGGWYDVSAKDEGNICIKAFTGGKATLLESIAITQPATKLTYQIGEALDISGLEITGTYSDGTTRKETVTTQNITGFDSSQADANQELTITIDGKTITYSVAIKGSGLPADCIYRTHVQNVGWQVWKSNGLMSGTSGESLRLEGIEIKVDSSDYDLGVEYSTHVQNYGWQDFRSNGIMSGTSGEGMRLEAIKIRLTGADSDQFDVYYRVHAQNVGWMDWAKNGAEAGTAGFGYRLEGIEIKVLPKGSVAPGPTAKPFIENN
ncbi:MAG: bacterial Ig-like domain-containing protein [Acetobacterium woodii]|nr:bacterial Ig-like domain-containing protein [Acetobacterium woodii]